MPAEIFKKLTWVFFDLGNTLKDLDPEKILESAKYDKALEHPYPEVGTVLTKLATKYKLAMIANQSQGTEERLGAYGLRSMISLLLSSTEEGIEKPDTAIFQRAMARARCTPNQAVMVGDRLDNDIAPANRSGWATVRVLQVYPQYQQPRNDREIPDRTVNSLSELLPVLSYVSCARCQSTPLLNPPPPAGEEGILRHPPSNPLPRSRGRVRVGVSHENGWGCQTKIGGNFGLNLSLSKDQARLAANPPQPRRPEPSLESMR